MRYMPPSKTDLHITPDKVFEIIQKTWHLKKDEMFDPCPIFPKQDGLEIAWKKFNFVNPPYSRPPKINGKAQPTLLHQFVMKAIKEQELYDNCTIMLLPSKTDQPWFHEIISRGYRIVWIKGRLKFKTNKDGATQPHFLVLIA